MRVSAKTDGPMTSQTVGSGAPAAPVGPSAMAVPVDPVVPSDALSVSSDAHLIAQAQAQLSAIPDVRTDKVEAIRAQIKAETYNPPSEAVADGIVKEYTPHRMGS